MLRLCALPTWHAALRHYELVAELTRGEPDSATGWSWLARHKRSGLFVELPIDAQRVIPVPQSKIAAALAAMERERNDL